MSTRGKWIVGTLAIVLFLGALSVGLEARKQFDREVARNHRIRDLRVVCFLFSEENDGLWPPLSPTPPHFRYDPDKVRAAYEIKKPVQGKIDAEDTALVMGFLHGQKAYSLRNLSDPAKYVYLGYAVTNEAEGLALLDAVRNAQAGALETDLPAPSGMGTLGSDRFARLNSAFTGEQSDDVAAKLRSTIPAIVERPFDDGKKVGGWVVYLDQHTEFVPYPGPFPMTEAFITALDAAH